MILSTLEFRHPALQNGVLRYVKDSMDLIATIESGQQVEFKAGQFEFQLPEKGSTGQEALQVVVPNSDRELVAAIEATKVHEPIINVISIYREYDADDLSQPRNKPIRLTTSSVKITLATINLTNSWKDLTNRRFMRRIYNTTTHPGLKYI